MPSPLRFGVLLFALSGSSVIRIGGGPSQFSASPVLGIEGGQIQDGGGGGGRERPPGGRSIPGG